MCFIEALFQLQRLACRSFGFGHVLFWVENAKANKFVVAERQCGISGPISGINGYRLLVILDGFLFVLLLSPIFVETSLKQQFISLRVRRLAPGELLLLACG